MPSQKDKNTLTAAERQWRYRQKRDNDPERRALYLAKSKQKYQTDKAIGKRKSINELTNRAQRFQRRVWRKQQKEHRKRVKQFEEILTPPNSPASQNENQEVQNPGPSRQNPGPSRQKSTEKKIKKRFTNKCFYDNFALQEEVDKLSNKVDMYKQRWLREKKKDNNGSDVEDTPRTKTKKLLRGFSAKSGKTVRKTLIFHNTLIKQLRKAYKQGGRAMKKNISYVLSGKLMKKYQLLKYARDDIGITESHGYRKRKGCLATRIGKLIRDFLERDDISKMTAGVKQTITRLKIKKQKRIMMDSMKNLYKKFLEEQKHVAISYASFCRLRPFWVVSPAEKDRDTCACKLHENFSLLVKSLYSKKIIQSDNMNELVSLSVCDDNNKSCMYNDCIKCKEFSIVNDKYDQNEVIFWSEWRNKKEQKVIKSEKKEITITVKEEIEGRLGDLVDKYNEEMVRFKRHKFNISNQMQHYRELKANLKDNEVLLHIDFAENYVSKMSTEIQSMHFGASKSQITLHTGVYYLKEQNPISFCTVSDSLNHSPAGIWAYLSPVIDEIQMKYPMIDSIHFFSDGPSTQYRQKNNFYSFSREIEDRGFKFGTWNFHESGHGKGAPDGIGGALKRAANMKVLHGKDIMNASTLVNELQENDTNIRLFEVQQEEIAKKQKMIPANLKSVPGTHKLHQVMSTVTGEVYYRDVSCFCNVDEPHEDHVFKKFVFKTPKGFSSNKKNPKQDFKNDQPIIIVEGPPSMDITAPAEQVEEETIETNHELDRDSYFEACINNLLQCSSFDQVKEACLTINDTMHVWPIDKKVTTIVNSGLSVDEKAMDIYPDDVEHVKFPVSVKADGNCLAYAGSVLAFGDAYHGTEIRVRIIVEQTINEKFYLDAANLKKGLKEEPKYNITKTFALYSDEYNHGIDHLNLQSTIQDIYRREVLKIRQPYTFMGIWQIFALSSILMQPVFSVYPKRGNINVRKDLHRIVHPRVSNDEENIVYVMWTTTRNDMKKGHWVPNHFVPVLPVDYICKDQDQAQTSTKENTPNETDKLLHDHLERWRVLRAQKLEKDRNQQSECEEKHTKNMEQVSKGDNMNTCIVETENKEVIDKTSDLTSDTTKESEVQIEKDVLCTNELLGKYVVVVYDDKPYPGIVIDTGDTDVLVRCMHCVGREKRNSSFFWPRAVKDECWYSLDDVITTIPEPLKIGRHYEVDEVIWEKVMENLQGKKTP